MTTPNLRGKAAVVTGGARRIGRAIALALAEAGADVAITYRSSQSDADATAAAIAALGVRSLAVDCDVRSANSVHAAVQNVAGTFGRLDVLVNNAAIFVSKPIEQIAVDEWDSVFATNTRGPFLFAREAIPYLRAAHGRIINLGSMGGLHPWPDHAHYCSAKAAVHMLTLTMARAFAPEVSVNCVAPGSIDADGNDTSDRARRFAEKTPMKRNGAAEDVAQAVLFFATGPSFITGQILSVDGGLGLV
jgi:3-oxoacyl-[acyl-carrier protein] reductase/pteridine reductase